MKKTRLPKGWTDERVRGVLQHYEEQSEDEAATEDSAAFPEGATTVIRIPRRLLPQIRAMIAKESAQRPAKESAKRPPRTKLTRKAAGKTRRTR
jgi:hypothetical protein